ncbi:hypothetical protein YC2023_009929 [Brassica napus]
MVVFRPRVWPTIFLFFFSFFFSFFLSFLTVSYILVFSIRGERSRETTDATPSVRLDPHRRVLSSSPSQVNRSKHHRRRLSRSSPRLLSSRLSEEGSKSTTCVSSVGPNGDSSVFSCLLRQTSFSVLFASPPSSLLKPVREGPKPTISSCHLRIKLPGPAILGERGLLHSPKTDLCQKVSSFELDDSLVHCVLPIFEVEDGAVQREEVRRECGKGFTSSTALCGHMACHFDREKRVSCSHFFQVKMSVKSSVISHGLV